MDTRNTNSENFTHKFWVVVFSFSSVSMQILISFLIACQASLSLEFSRQKYWSGLPFPSPGDPPDPGIEPESPGQQHVDSLPLYHFFI